MNILLTPATDLKYFQSYITTEKPKQIVLNIVECHTAPEKLLKDFISQCLPGDIEELSIVSNTLCELPAEILSLEKLENINLDMVGSFTSVNLSLKKIEYFKNVKLLKEETHLELINMLLLANDFYIINKENVKKNDDITEKLIKCIEDGKTIKTKRAITVMK